MTVVQLGDDDGTVYDDDDDDRHDGSWVSGWCQFDGSMC